MGSMGVVYSVVDEAIKHEYDMLKKNVNVDLCGVVMLNVKCVIIDVKNIFVIENEIEFVNGDKNLFVNDKQKKLFRLFRRINNMMEM